MVKTPKTITLPDSSIIKDDILRQILHQLFTILEENHQFYYNDLSLDVAILSVNDTTPSVKNKKVFITANTGSTTITNLDDWQDGQEITIICNDVNTSIVDGGSFKLSANWTPNADDTLKLICKGGVFYEVSRSSN